MTTQTMSKVQAEAIAGTLSAPSKMPCYSYGTPAEECITGAKLRAVAGTTCSKCYAFGSFYKVYAKTIKPAQYKRLESITKVEWADAMVSLIGRTKNEFFRWHDSGDVQSLEHLEKIADVARRLPQVKFWLPTREYSIVAEYRAAHGAFPINLAVRLSAHKLDSQAPNVGLPTSEVHTTNKPTSNVWECPARYQGNACGDCRACWSPAVQTVSYHQH